MLIASDEQQNHAWTACACARGVRGWTVGYLGRLPNPAKERRVIVGAPPKTGHRARRRRLPLLRSRRHQQLAPHGPSARSGAGSRFSLDQNRRRKKAIPSASANLKIVNSRTKIAVRSATRVCNRQVSWVVCGRTSRARRAKVRMVHHSMESSAHSIPRTRTICRVGFALA